MLLPLSVKGWAESEHHEVRKKGQSMTRLDSSAHNTRYCRGGGGGGGGWAYVALVATNLFRGKGGGGKAQTVNYFIFIVLSSPEVIRGRNTSH